MGYSGHNWSFDVFKLTLLDSDNAMSTEILFRGSEIAFLGYKGTQGDQGHEASWCKMCCWRLVLSFMTGCRGKRGQKSVDSS